MAKTDDKPSCPTAEELKRFVALDMTDDRRARIQRHLDGCAACRTRAERIGADCAAMDDELRNVHQAIDDDTRPPGPTVDAAGHLLGGVDPAPRVGAPPDDITIPGYEISGRYRLLERLGEGGMGEVFLAEQSEPVRRRVALKIIKLGMDTKEVVARFEAERQALALMNHPNVARVFDAGATEQGRPYFVMEHVPGVSITEYCDRERLTTKQRLALFQQVCHAVQHAHQKGIIHRDIKPSNVLVMMQDGQPVPKVIDFGVAKAINQRLTEKTVFTEQGRLIGTPEYMSPEQAEMTAVDIDTRTDIYSLGVLLYELLVGSLPFDSKALRQAGYAAVQQIIRQSEPPKPSTRLSLLGEASSTISARRRSDPSTLARQIRGDLDWIVMKCLEKDRTRRYASASDFAADIQRHLSHQPVIAGPPSAAYRVRKFVRRNRALVSASAVVFLTLVAGVVGTASQAVIATRQRDRAKLAETQQSRARSAEETQRKVAERREKEATEAQRLAQKRAGQLETVTEFQASMLSGIDAEQMGRGIIAAQRQGIAEGLENQGASADEIETALASFDELVRKTNATNLALKVIDENVLARAVETIEKDFADQPLVEAALRQTVGNTYTNLGLYPQALPQMERALALCRRNLGDDHPHTLISIHNMGYLLQSMGKLAEAEPYYSEALESRRRLLGDDHPETLGSMGSMGYLLSSMGNLAESQPYFRKALEGNRRVLGDDHPDTLTWINNMGALLDTMGKLAEAEPYYREALEARRRVLGDDHPRTLTSINNMGVLLKAMGKYAEAETYYREALEGKRRVLGDDHPNTLTSINNMGVLLKEMGKYAEAETYCHEALEGRRRVLGDDHPNTLMSMHNMGRLLRDLGRLDEAEALGAEAVRGATAKLAPSHAFRLGTLVQHGRTLTAVQRFGEAETELLEAYEGYVETRGRDHRYTKGAVEALVDLYDAWHAAEPDQGYDAKAAEWRAKLPTPERADSLIKLGKGLSKTNGTSRPRRRCASVSISGKWACRRHTGWSSTPLPATWMQSTRHGSVAGRV